MTIMQLREGDSESEIEDIIALNVNVLCVDKRDGEIGVYTLPSLIAGDLLLIACITIPLCIFYGCCCCARGAGRNNQYSEETYLMNTNSYNPANRKMHYHQMATAPSGMQDPSSAPV